MKYFILDKSIVESEILEEEGLLANLWVLTAICLIACGPLAIKNYLLGYHTLGSSLLLFSTLLFIDMISIHFKKRIVVNYNLVISLLIISVLLTTIYFGISGLFWIFPVSLTLTFIIPLRWSIFFNSILFFGAALISFNNFGLAATLRVLASFFFLCFISTMLLITIRDLSTKLREQSIKDPMTGVLNRRNLDSYLAHYLSRKKSDSLDSCLLLMDIDNFKKINDEFGHPYGDEVIEKISNVVKKNIRASDQIFRIGGDEFLAIIRDATNVEAHKIASKIRHIVEGSCSSKTQGVTLSIGMCQVEKFYTKDMWLKNADQALYEAKKAGRNCIVEYAVQPSDP